jgi:hypothetical protein
MSPRSALSCSPIADALNDSGADKSISALQITFRRPLQINMSNLKAEVLLCEFHYIGIRIPDPGPDLTVEQVRDFAGWL